MRVRYRYPVDAQRDIRLPRMALVQLMRDLDTCARVTWDVAALSEGAPLRIAARRVLGLRKWLLGGYR